MGHTDLSEKAQRDFLVSALKKEDKEEQEAAFTSGSLNELDLEAEFWICYFGMKKMSIDQR